MKMLFMILNSSCGVIVALMLCVIFKQECTGFHNFANNL